MQQVAVTRYQKRCTRGHSSWSSLSSWLPILALVSLGAIRVACQLPDDIQRELNQNLAEQARIQALQAHRQRLAQSRSGGGHQPQQPQQQQQRQGGQAQAHDPNNYSYQQVSPPIQYSYYQPFGDAAQPAAGQQQVQQQQPQAASPANFDLNNLNFDLPQPQAQVSSSSPPVSSNPQQQQVHLTPSFTGAGGLPVMKPVAASAAGYVPEGQAPLAPQARVQQGPPLTEADFKDITGGENYGAPGGNDFGLGDAASGGNSGAGANSRGDNTDAQLREFGLPVNMVGGGGSGRRNSPAPIDNQAQNMNIPDFGAFNPIGAAPARQRSSVGAGSGDPTGGFGDFGNLGGAGGMDGGAGQPRQGGGGGEFDFASQPSSNQGDQAAATLNGGAPGSLQSLLGPGFPGLGGGEPGGAPSRSQPRSGPAASGLDGFASGGNDPQAAPQRVGDSSMDIADLGDKSDQFSGADLGGFEQPSPTNDQDFNYAAPSNQQPATVPYPDGNPQPVGTLLVLTQPQSMTQARYHVQPDHGTYQDYPAYLSEPDGGPGSVAEVVDATPRARRAGPGRYGMPSPDQLAPERRRSGRPYDYSLGPWQGHNGYA